jgi:predicted GNAT family acetyltransferase
MIAKDKAESGLIIRPLTLDRWPAFEDLFGPERGANSGCWCMWPRMSRKEWHAMDRASRKAAFRAVVEQGPPPGLLAYEGEKAVGWCAVGPRSSVAGFQNARTSKLTELEAPDRVFAVTCFYIRTGYRGRGLMRKLAEAAVTYAKGQGAIAVDVCPIDSDRKLVWGEGFVGLASVFRALGFREIARRTPTRPLMRLDLSESAAA